jgi:hypothetical protein
MSARRTRRDLAGLGVALALAAGLTGCTLPDLAMSPDLSDRVAAASTPTATPTPTRDADAETTLSPAAATTASRPAGDLDTGSITHSVPAGNRSVVVDYWTGELAAEWTATSTKTIQVSAHVEGDDGEQAIQVTRFVATADDGSSRVTVAEDRGEFVITPPFDYTTALSLAPSTPTATELTLYVQFDLLVETEPGSGAYFRQTVLDSISLPLLQKDSQRPRS